MINSLQSVARALRRTPLPFARAMMSASVLLVLSGGLQAQETPERVTGPVIPGYGGTFSVPDPDFPTDLDRSYRIVFEIAATPDDPGAVNRQIETLARFLNMHGAVGVPLEQMQLAMVVHGPAGKDLLGPVAYEERTGVPNPNLGLIEALAGAGVEIILCGQTAAARNLPREGLAAPVKVALSAMTALATLQQDGYVLNPF